MGIVNRREDIAIYRELIKYVKYSKLERESKKFLLFYIDEVKDGKVLNDFVDAEILECAVVELLRHEYSSIEEFKSALGNLISKVRMFLPQRERTPEFEDVKREIITHYFNLIHRDLFSSELFSLFDNRSDFIQIMDIITEDQNLVQNFDKVVYFAVQIAKEIDDQGLIKREIISFLHLFGSILSDDKDYLQKRVDEARMRYGVYPGINEKTVATISREVEKARGILDKLEILEKKVDTYAERVDAKTKLGVEALNEAVNKGVDEIQEFATKSVAKMQEDLDKAKKELLEELNKYLVSLEDTMKANSDQVFNQLLVDAREKIEQIRVIAGSLSGTTTRELLRIQQETQTSLETLKNYVENNPQLHKSLKVAEDNEEVMKALLQFSAAQGEVNGAKAGLVIPSGGVVVPSSEVILPEEGFLVPKFTMTEGILPAFDRTNSFDNRMKAIEEKIRLLEQQGYIIPEALREALPWYLMGKKIVYFYGPTQSGKTTVADLLVKVVGSELLDGGKITEEHSVTSYNDVRGIFDENALFYALYYGKTIFYDEFDNGNPDNIIVLGTFISKLVNKIDNPEKDVRVQFAKRRFVPINANARMIAAGNTTGKGRNREYTARSRMDESSLERLVHIYVGYSDTVESKILAGHNEWLKFFRFFREQCNSWAVTSGMDSSEGNVTTGDASTIAECIKENSMDASMLINGIFVQTKEIDYLAHLIKNIKAKFEVEGDVPVGTVEAINKLGLDRLDAHDIASVFVYEATEVINSVKKLEKKK